MHIMHRIGLIMFLFGALILLLDVSNQDLVIWGTYLGTWLILALIGWGAAFFIAPWEK